MAKIFPMQYVHECPIFMTLGRKSKVYLWTKHTTQQNETSQNQNQNRTDKTKQNTKNKALQFLSLISP